MYPYDLFNKIVKTVKLKCSNNFYKSGKITQWNIVWSCDYDLSEAAENCYYSDNKFSGAWKDYAESDMPTIYHQLDPFETCARDKEAQYMYVVPKTKHGILGNCFSEKGICFNNGRSGGFRYIYTHNGKCYIYIYQKMMVDNSSIFSNNK